MCNYNWLVTCRAKSLGSRKRRLHCSIRLALKRGPVITAVITSKNSPPLLIPPTASISFSLAGRTEGILIKSSKVSQRDRIKRLKLLAKIRSSCYNLLKPSPVKMLFYVTRHQAQGIVTSAAPEAKHHSK
ncbi:hypothetical protein X798_01883 [Onchocerca flexuosa]|uniref:Uncharacterized protein n=1 Tax=Onchocerca flexuosa TaxID=387005 RepID=A0A238C0M2_9BILA|nr:hypothetical protein X798_01883 [Onchocerca flexuosa]